MSGRRFPPPWTAKPIPGGWSVVDANGRKLVYIYGRDIEMVNDDRMSVDEARRIAVNVARLPDLLKGRGARQGG